MFQSWFESMTDTEISFSKEEIFFCNHEDELLNVLFVIAKYSIFSRRCMEREPNVYIFKDFLMEIIKIERTYALKTAKYKPFVNKWKRLFILDDF